MDKIQKNNKKETIKTIRVLKGAQVDPLCVNYNATLKEAITMMEVNDFSQLPVVDSPEYHNGLRGVISWKSIGNAIFQGVNSGMVKDYITQDCLVLTPDTPLLDAIDRITEKEFAIIRKLNDKVVLGIITAYDVTEMLAQTTSPYLLVEEIESLLRYLLEGKYSEEDMKQACQESARVPESLEDLTFGEYINLINSTEKWKKFGIPYERAPFVKALKEVGSIRNAIMHFREGGISEEQQRRLESTLKLLRKLVKFK